MPIEKCLNRRIVLNGNPMEEFDRFSREILLVEIEAAAVIEVNLNGRKKGQNR